jgi:polyribonucleotide 5'-hydroxyl-kinase
MVSSIYQNTAFEFLYYFFIVDIIVVLDSEWLATKLISDLPSVKVITLPKSGGVSLLIKRKISLEFHP